MTAQRPAPKLERAAPDGGPGALFGVTDPDQLYRCSCAEEIRGRDLPGHKRTCIALARELRRRRRTLRPPKREEGVRHLAVRMRPIYSEKGWELPAGERLHLIGVAVVEDRVKETFGEPTRYAAALEAKAVRCEDLHADEPCPGAVPLQWP
jgi:hypothetical protein